MSVVTNLIIAFSTSEGEENIIAQLRRFTHHNSPFYIVSARDEKLPQDWYGGSKRLECSLLIGAYNHLNLNELISFMRTMKWEAPEWAQLIVREEEDFKFRIVDLFPEEQ
ncbi:hypothetical protein [Hymenobacter volaticus]|uniref:Uncharacterized protein n=1 Tax=Hymenobacter volaticus TaxID=2932254 RepID=A0ABY4G927_9BACT|nr:hypothetical protein [Hymenobacter volaticus]UOQ67084.1 hypothetical protein MUN86_04025 [Hymenobacter volaticus]